jgi:uncharacterized protein (DUF2236 family)
MASDVSAAWIEARQRLLSGMTLALGGANVIMQLSMLPVGRGVFESTVESGSLHRHPVKRTRTTLGYVMVAMFGTDHERDVLSAQVNRQHRAVRAGPDSPVAYDAFDPELQLWVAACMYRGVLDAETFLYGVPSDDVADELYAASARFATTLQVPPERWPEDRAAFERYWTSSIESISLDDDTRAFLYGIASLDFLPAIVRWPFVRLHRLITTGFLPEPFRDAIGLPWGRVRQRLFRWWCSSAATVNSITPQPVRGFPWNLALWDAQRRIRRGIDFV